MKIIRLMKLSSQPVQAVTHGLIAMSILVVCLFLSEESSPANSQATSSPSLISQEWLIRSSNELTTAEAKKTEDPKAYILALMHVADAATQSDRDIRKPDALFYSEKGDKYFKMAVGCYSKGKWNKQDSDEIASALWNGMKQRSAPVVESQFEELFKASDRHVEGKFERHDLEIGFALAQGEAKLPLAVQKKLLERAIAIRRSAHQDEVWRLASLFDDLVFCCRNSQDIKGAEINSLRRISVLETDPIEHARALIVLATFYVDTGMYDKADATWRRSVALTEQKRLAWPTKDFIDLIHTYNGRHQFKYLPALFDTLITNGDEFMFMTLDPLFKEYIENQIKAGELDTVAHLLEKRIAASPGKGTKHGSENWKIRLSEIYLAQGKTRDSASLFSQAMTGLEQQALPTRDFKSARAKLLDNMGMQEQAKALLTTSPKNSADTTTPDIILPACMVIKDKIEFGNDTSLTSFDSSDIHDYVLRPRSGGGGGGVAIVRQNNQGGSGDGSSIISLGAISGSSIGYAGIIYCNHSTITLRQNSTAKILPVAQTVLIHDAIDPPAGARTVVPVIDANVKLLERGDYILTDLGELTVRPQTSSTPIRVFLQDSPEKNEFVLTLHGPPVSFKQFQVWYKGSKTIKLKSANGLIYAPNATVEVPTWTGFLGVIVAKNFKTCNSATVWLDRGALNVNLTK